VVAHGWGITKNAESLYQSVAGAVGRSKNMIFEKILGDPWAIIDFLADTEQVIRSD